MPSVETEFDQAKSAIDNLMATIRSEPRRALFEHTQGELMTEYRYLYDMVDHIETLKKDFNKSLQSMKSECIRRSMTEQTDKFSNGVLSVTVKEQDTLQITGDWTAIQQTLIDDGYGYAIHRRLSASKLAEAFYDGALRLPDGLKIGSFRVVNQRRKNP